jgi:Kef-type K+ transport system membrane component KefB
VTTLLILFAVLHVFACFARLLFLSRSQYPRVITYSRGEDAWGIVIGAIMAVCIVLVVLSETAP